MYKIHEKYEDFNGVTREEDFYFNFTEAEITEMQYGIEGGFVAYVQRIISAQSTPELIKIFKDILVKSYGVKSDDGRRFIKSDELAKAFTETNAYSQIYMRLATDANAAKDFVNNVIPRPKNENNQSSIPTPALVK